MDAATIERFDPLNAKRADRRLLALAIGTVAAFGLVACGQNGPSPTQAPQGVSSSTRSDSIPRPDLATTSLGSSRPGYDGSSDFLSFASELSPDRALTAYADQLIEAGYRDAGRQGAWLVFVDTTMTVWVRVGSIGPPTSLVVRFASTQDAGLEGPSVRPSPSAPAPGDAAGTGTKPATKAPRDTGGATSARRPDPPHAAGVAGTGSSSGTATGGSKTGPGSTGAGQNTGSPDRGAGTRP